jgi:tetratricopeptide (TPR) repeat protein
MKHYGETGNRLRLEGVRAELAGMFLNVRQFEAVIEPAERALRFFEQIKHERWITAICNNLAEAYMETGQIDKAKEYALRVLHMEVPVAQPNALYTLGHVHERQGNLGHAEVSFREGIQIAQAHHNRFLEAYLQRALGNLYLQMERYEESRARLEAALKLFKEMDLEAEVAETNKSIQAVL